VVVVQEQLQTTLMEQQAWILCSLQSHQLVADLALLDHQAKPLVEQVDHQVAEQVAEQVEQELQAQSKDLLVLVQQVDLQVAEAVEREQ
jgi:hypothetical protein